MKAFVIVMIAASSCGSAIGGGYVGFQAGQWKGRSDTYEKFVGYQMATMNALSEPKGKQK